MFDQQFACAEQASWFTIGCSRLDSSMKISNTPFDSGQGILQNYMWPLGRGVTRKSAQHSEEESMTKSNDLQQKGATQA